MYGCAVITDNSKYVQETKAVSLCVKLRLFCIEWKKGKAVLCGVEER